MLPIRKLNYGLIILFGKPQIISMKFLYDMENVEFKQITNKNYQNQQSQNKRVILSNFIYGSFKSCYLCLNVIGSMPYNNCSRMIYSHPFSSFYFLSPNSYPIYTIPQVFIPVSQDQPVFEVTGNIKKQEISTTERQEKVVEKRPNRVIKRKKGIYDTKKYPLNIKNVIPNLVRKLFGFLTSQRCKDFIQKIDPQVTKIEISKIIVFVQSIKNSLGTYVGKSILKKLWFKDQKSNKSKKVHEVLRRVSRYYYEVECPNSIILSKRIKSSLKPIHLKYRRKLLRLLGKNIKEDI